MWRLVCVEAMKLVVLNCVDYKTPKKYLAHYMTLHNHLHIPACFSKLVYRYKIQYNSLNFILILTISVSFESSVSALFEQLTKLC